MCDAPSLNCLFPRCLLCRLSYQSDKLLIPFNPYSDFHSGHECKSPPPPQLSLHPPRFGQGAAGWKPQKNREGCGAAAQERGAGSGQRLGAAVWQVAAGWVQSTSWAAAHGPQLPPPPRLASGGTGELRQCVDCSGKTQSSEPPPIRSPVTLVLHEQREQQLKAVFLFPFLFIFFNNNLT